MRDMQGNSDEYREGWLAYSNGQKDCPYINYGAGHRMWMDWNRGWADARGQKKLEELATGKAARRD